MLLSIDLESDYNQLKIDLTETKSELKKTKITKRLKLIESFILSKTKSSVDELFDETSELLSESLSSFIVDSISSISASIVCSLDIFTGSSGSGRVLKSGGKTNGFFLITKNSSLDSYFFPWSASVTDWHEKRGINNININNFLVIFLILKKDFI